MSILYGIAGVITVILIVYLFIALFKPELF